MPFLLPNQQRQSTEGLSKSIKSIWNKSCICYKDLSVKLHQDNLFIQHKNLTISGIQNKQTFTNRNVPDRSISLIYVITKNIKFYVTDHPDTCSLYRLELQSLVQAWHLQTAQPNHWGHHNSQQELRNCWDDTARAKESSTPYLWGGLPFRGWIQTHILQDLAVLCATIIITPITDPVHMDIQPGGVVVRALDLWLRRSWVRLQSCAFRKEPWASCSHTKKYNLVPVKEQWCPAAGKVTVGLVSHWPCITDFSGLSTCGLKA